jgi:hypothetical protein
LNKGITYHLLIISVRGLFLVYVISTFALLNLREFISREIRLHPRLFVTLFDQHHSSICPVLGLCWYMVKIYIMVR